MRLGWLAAAFCLALSGVPESVRSQEHPTTPETTQDEAPETTQNEAQEPAAEKSPEPAQGVRRFEDWELRCEQKDEWEEKTCYISQSLTAEKSDRRVLQVLIAHFGEERLLGALISVPIGIRLPPGLVMQIDKEPARRFPLERCTPQTCQAQVRLDDKLLASFKAGMEVKVTFYEASGQAVHVTFSLKGFTAAFKELP